MNILFTGGSGFIGSHFHEALNHSIISNLDLERPAFEHGAKFFQGDIRVKKDVERAVVQSQPEVIVSLAAEHKDFGISKEAYFRTNAYGTQVICEVATAQDIKKIVFYSSVAVYGNNTSPSSEEMTPNPANHYGASKLAGEEVLKKWAAADASRSVLIIRPVVVYGERNVANMYRLIEQINKQRYFHIGKGDNVKSIAYVKNLVNATLFQMKRMQPGVEIFNYADNSQLTSRGIAEHISECLGQTNPITLPYNLVYTMGLPFDLAIKLTGKDLPISTNRIKKFCTETFHKAEKIQAAGFVPSYSNEEGLKRMVEWYVLQQNGVLELA